MALEAFFVVNSLYLALEQDAIHQLAVETAGYRELGTGYEEMLGRIESALQESVIPFGELDTATRTPLVRIQREMRATPALLRRM